VIWRYVDLAKFVDMVQRESLWFARADTLGDSFEGSVPPQFTRDWNEATLSEVTNYRKAMRQILYVNCWTAMDYESVAMWNEYSRSSLGLAVRSTVGRLIESVGELDLTWHVASVEYVDYETASADPGDLYTWFFRKRRSFEHEREIRAIAHDPAHITLLKMDDPGTPRGVRVTTDLNVLVEAVYVKPMAPDWYADLVVDLLRRYQRDWPVQHSDLDRDPIF
jgi:hypothetical protein